MEKFVRLILNLSKLLIIISVISCINPYEECNFKEAFKSKLENISKGEKPGEVYNVQIKRINLLYLNSLTGIVPNCDLEYAYYGDATLLQKDIVKWERWYEQNKSKYSLHMADSIAYSKIYGIKYNDFDMAFWKSVAVLEYPNCNHDSLELNQSLNYLCSIADTSFEYKNYYKRRNQIVNFFQLWYDENRIILDKRNRVRNDSHFEDEKNCLKSDK